MQIQKKCRVARPKLAGVVQPGDAAHAQLSSRKVTGGTATPTPVRPPPQEPHLELSEPVCSWDIKSGLAPLHPALPKRGEIRGGDARNKKVKTHL